jgi:poly(3-hydroxybutyrate) depolymerase
MQQSRAKLGTVGGVAIVVCAWLAVCPPSAVRSAAGYAAGPQVLTFYSEFDNSDQPYALYLPKNFSPAAKYPLVVALHGAGANHRTSLARVFGASVRGGEFPALPEVNYIVAAPLARGSLGYLGVAERDVYDMLADVKRRFPVDEDRVYLTGESMGGSGTFWLGLTRPDVWAAIAPVCGGAPAGTEELAPNALNLPVKLTHGDRDQTVPVEIARRWREHFTQAGVKLDYKEYPGFDHNVWDVTYKDGAVFEWFSQHRRDRFPRRVRFVARDYRHAAAYWVELDRLTPGTLAAIDARFTGENQIEITTENLDGFTLRLAGHPSFNAARPLKVKVGGKTLVMKTGGDFSFGERRKAEARDAEKRRGLEGPMIEVVSSRHVYVYGTADDPDEAELNRRKRQAATAADWAGPRARPNVSFQVLADAEVKEGDLRQANLVLFGTKETNSLIARYAGGLPLELKREAADYGLLFVAPIEGRPALVSSGLAWWEGGERAARASFRWQWMSLAYRLLVSFEDYVVFSGSVENVIAEGRFDRRWRAPEAQAAKLRATGAVDVR